MPTLQWNERWKTDLAEWRREHAEQPFGDQWGDPDVLPALAPIKDRFILPFIDPGKTALEIGSGGGRWTQYLLDFGRLLCVDIHADMFHYLLDRFGPRANVSFCRSNGSDFPGVGAGTVDYVFTFGTFVHLDPVIIDSYLANLLPLLKPGADLILQYADKNKPMAAANEGFAATTAAIVNQLLRHHGYAIVGEELELLPHSNIVHARLEPPSYPQPAPIWASE